MHFIYFQISPKVSNEKHGIVFLNVSFYNQVQMLVLIFLSEYFLKIALFGLHRTQQGIWIYTPFINVHTLFYKVKCRQTRRRFCHRKPCLNLPEKARPCHSGFIHPWVEARTVTQGGTFSTTQSEALG